MKAHVGDTIVLESEKVGQPGRTGVIEEVLQGDPARVRVCWEDGHTSILTPSAGVARIAPKQKTVRRR
jgi:Glu-tRNA(Gln) amidotransferase subunit E-like FAD-binding protein